MFVPDGWNAAGDIFDKRSCFPVKVHAGGGFDLVCYLTLME